MNVTMLPRRRSGRGPVRVAVVGAGDTGEALAATVHASPATELAALCDRSMPALSRVAPRHLDTRLIVDFSEVVEDPTIEAVVIATPLRARHRLAMASLASGKHTLVHGTLATTSAQADELHGLARHLELTLMAGFSAVHAPGSLYLGELIARGGLGDLRLVSSSRSVAEAHGAGESVVAELAAAEIARLIGWLGELPAVTAATGRSVLEPGVPDIAFIALAFPSGVVANVELVRPAAQPAARVTVVGSAATAVCHTGAVDVLRVIEAGGGEVRLPRLVMADPLAGELAGFVEAVVAARPGVHAGHELAVAGLVEQVDGMLASG